MSRSLFILSEAMHAIWPCGSTTWYNWSMSAAKITEEIAEAVEQQPSRPLLVTDAAGKVYYVMTDQTFSQYVYDDSELTTDEMIAAAASGLDDPEGWGAAGMDDYDQDDTGPTS